MVHTARRNAVPPVTNMLSRSGGNGKEILEDLAGRHFGRQVEVFPLFCVLFWRGLGWFGLGGRCICRCKASQPPQTRLLEQEREQNTSKISGEDKAAYILPYTIFFTPGFQMRGCDTQHTGNGRD